MSLITILWSATASACITLALVHGLVWCRQRDALANFMFSLVALSTAGMGALELCMMKAPGPEQYSTLLRWFQVPVWLGVLSLAGFIRHFLRPTGSWVHLMGLSAVVLRTICLVINFTVPVNLNYRELTELRSVTFLGESVAVPVGVANPWMSLAQLSLIMLLVYVVLGALAAHRRGDCRTALVVGSGITLFVLAGTAQAILVFWGMVDMPITASLFFLGCVAAMSHELSLDLLAARRQAADLRQSQEQIQLAADSASVGFWSLDKATGRGWMPPATRALFGLDDDVALDITQILQVVHPDDRERVQDSIRKALDKVQHTRTEFRIIRPDGAQRCVVSLGRSLLDDQGVIIGRTGVLIDVTSQRLTEEALEQEQSVSRAVFDSVPGLLYLYDQEGRLVRWNQRHEILTGYSSEELQHITAADWFEGEDLAIMKREWKKVFNTGQTITELNLKMKDGRKVPYLLTGVRLEIEGRQHLVGIGIDISERKRVENELEQKREEMAHLSRVASLGELSGALAHELNQPLCSILSNAQAAQRLLAREKIDLDEMQEILADIVSEDRRAGEVIERLRALLKRGETKLQPLDLHACMEEVLKLMHGELVARGVIVARECPPSVPAVLADHVQLQQVFINLIANACDAMDSTPPGRRLLTLRCREEGKSLHMEVQDTGAGFQMPADDLFQPFHTTKAEGMGMGLAICRTIVDAHHGRLWAEPCAAGGAVFHLTLPFSVSSSA